MIQLALAYLRTNAMDQVQSILGAYGRSLSEHPDRATRAGIFLVQALAYQHQGKLELAKYVTSY